MDFITTRSSLVFLALAATGGCATVPDKIIDMGSDASTVDVYFTRHAEKQTQLEADENGALIKVCGEKKCAEELNPAGAARAVLLAKWFQAEGITPRLTHAFSSHKLRTLQTIQQIAADTALNGDEDKNPGDGVQELPVYAESDTFATELNPESTKGSVSPTVEALKSLPAGSVALVAGHSGTLYKIMLDLGLADACAPDNIDNCDVHRYPVNAKNKVANFGDIWHVQLTPEGATFDYRVNLQAENLETHERVE